jgi:arylsulfatase A-like enzyme
VIFGDDIGQTNLSAYSFGLMGYRTPNIDRIAKEGMMFTDYYAHSIPSCHRHCTYDPGGGAPSSARGSQWRETKTDRRREYDLQL